MNTDPRARFPRSARVRLRAEYALVFDPRAVGRNRIKRVLRDATRRLRPQLAGGDYVVVARVAARTASNAQLVEAWHRLLQRAGALPHPGGTGTMPAIQSSQSPTSPSSTPTSTPDA